MIIYENKKIKLDQTKETLNRILKDKLEYKKNKLALIKANYIISNPSTLYKDKKKEITNIIDKLELLNPLGVLKRGYTLTSQEDKIIKSIKNIDTKKPITIKLHDGIIDAEIKNIKEN